MKVTRALLLSSKNQAEAWEPKPAWFTPSLYRYLVTDLSATGDGMRFQIFRMVDEEYVDERKQQRTRRKAVDTPHVDETFDDMDKLIDFLKRYQIEFEDCWWPVEE